MTDASNQLPKKTNIQRFLCPLLSKNIITYLLIFRFTKYTKSKRKSPLNDLSVSRLLPFLRHHFHLQIPEGILTPNP